MTLHSLILVQTIAKSVTGYKPVSSIKSLERTFLGAWGRWGTVWQPQTNKVRTYHKQVHCIIIETDNMAISPQLLSDLRLPELTANCCPTNSWNWPTVLDEQLFVAEQFTDKCVRKLIFTFSWHECCKLSSTYLYHNTLMSYQQGPPVLHFFSGDKRKWQYMVFLFCESMKIWRRKVNKVSLYSVQIWFIPVVQFF